MICGVAFAFLLAPLSVWPMRTPTPIASSSVPTPATSAVLEETRCFLVGRAGAAGAAAAGGGADPSANRGLPRRSPQLRQYFWSVASGVPQAAQRSPTAAPTNCCVGASAGSPATLTPGSSSLAAVAPIWREVSGSGRPNL